MPDNKNSVDCCEKNVVPPCRPCPPYDGPLDSFEINERYMNRYRLAFYREWFQYIDEDYDDEQQVKFGRYMKG